MSEKFNNLQGAGILRLGLVSPELRVADISFNTGIICETLEKLAAQGCQLVLFPELCLTGATCADLFGQELLIQSSLEALKEIEQTVKKLKIHSIVGLPIKIDEHLYNAAAFISPDGIQGLVLKTLINQSFDQRQFSPAVLCKQKTIEINGRAASIGSGLIFKSANIPGCIIGIEFGDELLSANPPSNQMVVHGANLILSPAAIVAELGSAQRIKEVVHQQSEFLNLIYGLASCGPNESTTDNVYSGQCLVADKGNLLAETFLYSFDTQYVCADVSLRLENDALTISENPIKSKDELGFQHKLTTPLRRPGLSVPRDITRMPFVPADPLLSSAHCQEALQIQAAGLAKRIKFTSTQKLVLGLSGGMDSTLALLVSMRALALLGINKQNILALSMPGPGTSRRSQEKSTQLAKLTSVSFIEIPIHQALFQHFKDIQHSPDQFDITYENAQARERTQILMDKANQVGGLVVGTGDLSELALGWCTFNADHMSMYHVNAGVPKTLVKAIIQWAADTLFTGELTNLLYQICDDPVTPELLPINVDGTSTQNTEELIGPYILHDFTLYHTLNDGLTPKSIFEVACQAFNNDYSPEEILHWLAVFYRRFFAQQYKRSVMPDGPRVTAVSLSPRGQWFMPSDASSALWLDEISKIESDLRNNHEI